MMLNKIIKIAFLISLILMTGCNKYDKNNVSAVKASESAMPTQTTAIDTKPKDTLVLGISRPTTLNPLLNEDLSVSRALKLVFTDMVSLTPDDQISYNLLDSYSLDAGSNTALVTLKGGVSWQDGEGQVSADDLIYSLNTLKGASDAAIYKPMMDNIVSYKKVNNLAVSFVLREPMAGLPYFLEFPIIPQHFFANYASADGVHFDPIVGDGMYKNTENDIHSNLFLEASNLNGSNPSIKKIELKILKDTITKYASFEQGQIDAIVENVNIWNKYHVDKITNITQFNEMNMEVLGFNFKNPIIFDLNFRQAIEMCVPRNQINKTIYLDLCDQSTTVLPTNHFSFDGNIKPLKSGADGAKEKLKHTKYNGEVLKIIINDQSVERKKTVELIEDQLKIAGIKCEYVELSQDDFLKALTSGDYDMFIADYSMGALPDYSNLFGKSNLLGYSNPTLNDLIQKSKSAINIDEYKSILSSIQQIVNDDIPVIPLFYMHDAIITGDNITAFVPESYNNPYGSMDKFTIAN